MPEGARRFSPLELGLDERVEYEQIIDRYTAAVPQYEASGDVVKTARSHLAVAFATEKLGRYEEAMPRALLARELLETTTESHWLAEANHSIGVWRYHNTDEAPPAADFERAIDIRNAVGELLGAAQSAHNLALVLLMSGATDAAQTNYDRSATFLSQVRADSAPELAASAHRQMGFVLSHKAFAAARYGQAEVAFRATQAYLDHAEATGAHREPVYAYVAPGIALRREPDVDLSRLVPLSRAMGLDLTPRAWLEYAVSQAHTAMISQVDTGTGRHAYLGAEILALAELARWFESVGLEREAGVHRAHAVALAEARGWKGEALRAAREVSAERNL